jgi:hypothetical protein
MPFHAFVTTWLGSWLGQRGVWQSWKELLISLMAIAFIQLCWKYPTYRQIWQTGWVKTISGFTIIGLLVSLFALMRHDVGLTPLAYGLKIDLEYWIVALMALAVATKQILHRAIAITLVAGAVVSGFVVLQAYVLPADWLTMFGYGSGSIPPYLYLTATSDTLRFAGTLGGPNQLGTYLVIVIALTLTQLVRRPWLVGTLGLNVVALWHSYSRSAWLAATATLPILWIHIPHRHRRLAAFGGIACLLLATIITMAQLNKYPALQESLLHSPASHHQNPASSDSLRLTSIVDGLEAVAGSPLGHGFGSAGPATFQASQPFIIENQFLQIAYETGWLGLVAFGAGLGFLIWSLWVGPCQPVGKAIALALAAISFAGLMLPTFSDSTTTLIAFILAGLAIGEDTYVKTARL